jgi:carboxylesterase type B
VKLRKDACGAGCKSLNTFVPAFVQPPQPLSQWQNVFNAKQLSNACMQDGKSSMLKYHFPAWKKFSEDCLNLNIFAPQVKNQSCG